MLSDRNHRKQIKIEISGDTYEGNQISSCRVYSELFSESSFGIGGAVSAQIDLDIINPREIPRGAEIKVFLRLVTEENQSEWVPQGIFYIDTRETGSDNILTIHGYDAMLRAEEVWLTADYAPVNWPMSHTEAVNDIANRLGVDVDSRTVLTDQFPVDYPVDEYGDMTMREVLSGIAAINGGNWIITYEGKLCLRRISDIPTDTSYLVEDAGNPIAFGEVRILV